MSAGWCHSSLAWPPGAGYAGTWLRCALTAQWEAALKSPPIAILPPFKPQEEGAHLLATQPTFRQQRRETSAPPIELARSAEGRGAIEGRGGRGGRGRRGGR